MIERKYIIGAAVIIIALITASMIIKHRRWEQFYNDYPKGKIRIEVLNGTPSEGFAFKMTKILRYHGFDVVDFKNAESIKYKKTVIIDMRGNNSEMKILEKFFETDQCITLYSDRSERENIDATVILGSDLLDLEKFSDKRYSGRILLDDTSKDNNRQFGR